MYADNVLLYLSVTTIPYLKNLISTYGYFSGYKINVDKTMAMDIGAKIPNSESGFKWPTDGFKYLGTHIPTSLNKLYEVNYESTLTTISKDLDQWSTLTLSLIGRAETVRMNNQILAGSTLRKVYVTMPFIELPKGEARIGEWTRVTLNIWRKIKLTFRLPKANSALTNIGFIIDLAPSQLDV